MPNGWKDKRPPAGGRDELIKVSPCQAIEEKQWIALGRAGDIEAFEKLVVRYQTRIYHIGLRMLQQEEDAADMTQEVLLKIYRSLPSFRGDASFSTWVYRIAVNTCYDFLRRNAKRKEDSLSDLFCEGEAAESEWEVADYSALPEQLLVDWESEQYLLYLLDGLSPKYRLVMMLREVVGLSYQEIAEATQLSLGTIKSRLNRARKAMRQRACKDAEHIAFVQRLMERGRGDNGQDDD